MLQWYWHLLETYLEDINSDPLKTQDQALDHLHPVHKIPYYSKHPEEKAKSIDKRTNIGKWNSMYVIKPEHYIGNLMEDFNWNQIIFWLLISIQKVLKIIIHLASPKSSC